jgi:pimeloyl-ACP methyl ester carboxylesterase
VTSMIARPDRGITAPGPLLYLTEPARAVVDFGLLTACAPLLAALPRGDGHPYSCCPGWVRPIRRRSRCGPCFGDSDTGRTDGGWAATSARRIGRSTVRVARRDQLTTRFGQPVSLIGWGLGGIFARHLARRTGRAVRQSSPWAAQSGSRAKSRATPMAWSAIALIGTSRPGTCLSNTATAHCRCPRPRSTHRWTASSRGGPA